VIEAERTGRLAADVEAWVLAGAGGESPCEGTIETSISWLFLFSARVLKFKKPVDLGFADFTTPERRLWAARRELAFNRLTAPDLYRRLVVVGRIGNGEIGECDAQAMLDIAVEMRRFPQEALLAQGLPRDGAFAEELGRRIARIHLAAAPGRAGAGAAGLRYVIDSNAEQFAGHPGKLQPDSVAALGVETLQAWEELAGLLDERAERGFCRACHGDLHLENIVLLEGEPTLFDCIEFSDRLREIDVLYDIAFLLMDLALRGAKDAANRTFNGWLDETARGLDGSVWRGLAALPLFQAVRATIRAHVNAREGKDQAAQSYLAAAAAWLQPRRARLVAVGGLSGSGKTTLARRMAPQMGPPPGGIVLRSDEIRKRLLGHAPTERLGPEAYSTEVSARVYDALASAAADCLAAGQVVIADAVFLSPQQRGRIEAVARTAGAPFEGVWLEAPEMRLRERLDARSVDASDADAAALMDHLVTADERQLNRRLACDAAEAPAPAAHDSGRPGA
jgi:aminoglycoside phosphotransferase family enzyme/predicted kinase